MMKVYILDIPSVLAQPDTLQYTLFAGIAINMASLVISKAP